MRDNTPQGVKGRGGMILSDIEKIQSDWLTPAQIAPYLNSDPQTIRMAARKRPELLGFPVTVIGSRVKIPKAPFVKYCKGEDKQ